MTNIQIEGEVKERLDLVLRDFGAPDKKVLAEKEMMRIPIEPERAPLPYLLRYLLLDAVGAAKLPAGDKTAWEVGFSYRDLTCTLALMKFGLRLYLPAEAVDSDAAGQKLAKEVIGKLGKAGGLIEKEVLAPLAEEQLAGGNVTIVNQIGWLRGMYRYLRSHAEASFAKGGAKTGTDEKDPFPLISEQFRRDRNAGFNALAAINAYFSVLEHILVLVLPFVDFDPREGRLSEFVGKRWGDKFKAVFDLAADPEANRAYSGLREIAETYRNTYGHGGFDKDGAALYVHVPGVSALPAALTDVRESPHFRLFPVDAGGFGEISATFDRVDEWLAQTKTGFGMRWIEAGLDVAFDEESRRRYEAAMQSDSDFEEFLELEARRADAIANFEIY